MTVTNNDIKWCQ